MNDPLPPLVASFDQLAACMRPVAGFCAAFHRELVKNGMSGPDATLLVISFMQPFAEHLWTRE